MDPLIERCRPSLGQLCRDHGIRRLSVFGSAVRDNLSDQSDIDLLVEFEDVETPGYADRYLKFVEAAETTLARPVDVLTMKSLRNPYLKQRVEQEAIKIHGP